MWQLSLGDLVLNPLPFIHHRRQVRAPFGGGVGRGFQATDGSVVIWFGLTPNLALNLVLNLAHHTSSRTVRKEGMEHEPSNYTGTITLTFQQMCEVHKAISDRIVTLVRREYEYKEQDIANLLEVAKMLSKHTDKGIAEWEAKVAQDEANLMTDEAVEKWLGDE